MTRRGAICFDVYYGEYIYGNGRATSSTYVGLREHDHEQTPLSLSVIAPSSAYAIFVASLSAH